MAVLVSINCMTYNHEEYIAEAIESFLMQITEFNYEILIGEDCSTDNTKIIVENYMRMYPKKIRIITSEENVGAKMNSQRLLENSKGKYIAECEGDDYWIDPYKLQKQVDYMEAHPTCTLCFHASETIQAPKKPTGRVVRPYNRSKISPVEDIISGGGRFCDTASLFYPKKLMEDSPEFYREAIVGDYPLQMILASQGYAYYIDECMSAYRSGVEGSWTMRLNAGANVRGNIIKVNEGIIQLLNGFNKYSSYKYINEIENICRKLEFELLVLQKKTKEQKHSRFNNYNWLFKLKVKIKIRIRCNFPSLFLKLVNLKDVKISKTQWD